MAVIVCDEVTVSLGMGVLEGRRVYVGGGVVLGFSVDEGETVGGSIGWELHAVKQVPRTSKLKAINRNIRWDMLPPTPDYVLDTIIATPEVSMWSRAERSYQSTHEFAAIEGRVVSWSISEVCRKCSTTYWMKKFQKSDVNGCRN